MTDPSKKLASRRALLLNLTAGAITATIAHRMFAMSPTPNPSNVISFREQSDSFWRSKLTPEQYEVLRNHGTERAFSGALHAEKKPGLYSCAGCDQELFSSEHKFDSGTGWPSFWQPIRAEAVGTKTDRKFFMVRTEVHCSRCLGHLGHVFEDGPKPTGLRYCINSVALTFRAKSDQP